MARGIFDDDVETYFYELTSTKIDHYLLADKKGISNTLIQFMQCDDNHAQHIIQNIDSTFRAVCGRLLIAYDPFANFDTEYFL